MESNRFLNLLKYKIHISFVPAIPQIEFIIVKMIPTHKELSGHIRMFLVTFSYNTKNGKEKKKKKKRCGGGSGLNVHYWHKWLNNLWYTHTMQYYTAIRISQMCMYWLGKMSMVLYDKERKIQSNMYTMIPYSFKKKTTVILGGFF